MAGWLPDLNGTAHDCVAEFKDIVSLTPFKDGRVKMAPIDENTNLEISLKAVISIVFAVFTLTTAFVTLDGRIISLESSQADKDMIIKENQSFTRDWPHREAGAAHYLMTSFKTQRSWL